MSDNRPVTERIPYEASCTLEVPGEADREVICTVNGEQLILSQFSEVPLSKIEDVQVGSDIVKFTCSVAMKQQPLLDTVQFKYINENNKPQTLSLKLSSDIADELRKEVVRRILTKSRDWINWTDSSNETDDRESKTYRIHRGLREIGIESCIAPKDNPGKRLLKKQYKDSPELIYIRRGPVHWMSVHQSELSFAGLVAFGWSYLTYRAATSFIDTDYVDYGIPDRRLEPFSPPANVHLNIKSKSVIPEKPSKPFLWVGEDRNAGLVSRLNEDRPLTDLLVEYARLRKCNLSILLRTGEVNGFWTISLNMHELPDKSLWDALQLIARHLLASPAPESHA
jgi:hypothetical protein